MTRWRAVATVCVWLVLCVSLAATDARPAVLALGGIVAVVAAVIVVMFDLAKAVIRVGWIPPRRLPRSSSRGSDPRVGSLRNQLHDARWFGSTELRANSGRSRRRSAAGPPSHRPLDRFCSSDGGAHPRPASTRPRLTTARSWGAPAGPNRRRHRVALKEAHASDVDRHRHDVGPGS